MGNYISYSGLQDRLGSANLTALLDHVDSDDREDYCDDVITRVEGKIHTFCSKSYETPFTDADTIGMATEWAYTLAEYELRRLSPTAIIPEKTVFAYEEVMRELREVRDGKLSLAAEDPPTGGSANSYFTSDTALFSDESGFTDVF